jgi:anti-sigma factor RsiW
MLTCREVSRLVASGDLAGQSAFRRLRVRIHLLGCDHCKRYARELRAISAAARRLLRAQPLDPERPARLEQAIIASARERGTAP